MVTLLSRLKIAGFVILNLFSKRVLAENYPGCVDGVILIGTK